MAEFSRFGATLDPIADKTSITVAFECFVQVELIPCLPTRDRPAIFSVSILSTEKHHEYKRCFKHAG
jgi:phosphatidylglycerophosphate synthase